MFDEFEFNGDLSDWKPVNVKDCHYMFYKTQCSIPYWYSENAQEIPQRIKKYKEVQELEEKLKDTLTNQKLDNNKVKL